MEGVYTIHNTWTTPRISVSIRHTTKRSNERIRLKMCPKTRTYSMTISLTNRGMIAVDISNPTTEQYWVLIYSSLYLTMVTKPPSSSSLKTPLVPTKKYQGKTDIKSKRVKDTKKKLKTWWRNTKLTKNETCLTNEELLLTPTQFPTTPKRRITTRRRNWKSPTLFGCFVKGHKSTLSKKCRYNGFKNEGISTPPSTTT